MEWPTTGLFSDAFKEALDGIGFSILAERNSTYFTCIPALRRLTDPNDDGVADTNEKIVNGFECGFFIDTTSMESRAAPTDVFTFR